MRWYGVVRTYYYYIATGVVVLCRSCCTSVVLHGNGRHTSPTGWDSKRWRFPAVTGTWRGDGEGG